MTSQDLISVPTSIGRRIVEDGTLFCCPLLNTDKFVSFCTERKLSITRKRLFLLERLGLFVPIFRVRSPPGRTKYFRIPVEPKNNWFERGWAWDTTARGANVPVPNPNNRNREGYYSIFQIDHLAHVLNRVTIEVQLDWELEGKKTINWNKRAALWLEFASVSPNAFEFRRALAVLCQYISERYYPSTQSDQRMMQVGRGHYSDPWIGLLPDDDWEGYARSWKPELAASLFNLTPEKLRHAFMALAAVADNVDPLEKWHQLVQFVAVDQRARLKGDALQAETLRSGALMLRALHKDLYGEELPHPNEAFSTIIMHMPELEVRNDTRRYLEFVTNRFHLNPQPIAALIVEGASEKAAIDMIFEQYVGSHPGHFGIEIIVLGGVDTATGTKHDRFRAILRLIDYLHHHQTPTFLVLDNERHARKLRAEVPRARSIHHPKRYVTRLDYTKFWRRSFEFDNYSCSEIAKALCVVAGERSLFSTAEVAVCKRHLQPGAALKQLYQSKMGGKKLNKLSLTEELTKLMLSPKSRRRIATRPIVKLLDRIARLALRNPLPHRLETWELNQTSTYLGKARARKRH